MARKPSSSAHASAEVVDFDDAILDACPANLRADLMAEAALLVRAFAPQGDPEHLAAMAQALSSGERDAEVGRRHARRLAAALRHMARRNAA